MKVRMSAYIVGAITVRDEASWARYLAGVAETFRRYDGEVLLRAAGPVPLAGRVHGERVVVARFASMAGLRRWFDSPEYQALIPLRDAAADVVLTAYED
jgi:uncharacterized protein (DUF1330 family)